MTPGIVIGKLVAFEMSRKMGQEEASSSSKGKALACNEKKKMKGKQIKASSSSSSSSEDEEEEDDDDEDSSDDDQSSSSTSDLDEESIKLVGVCPAAVSPTTTAMFEFVYRFHCALYHLRKDYCTSKLKHVGV